MVNQKHYECDICKSTFKTKPMLIKHNKIHQKGRHLITRPMKKSKAVRSDVLDLNDESIIMKSDNDFDNAMVTETVVSSSVGKPKKYEMKRRKSMKKVHTCTVCYKTFPTNFKLIRHGYTHMAVKPFPCDICGRRFSRKDHLQVHYRIHTGEKVCYCTECGQGFNSSTTLHRHIERLHSVDRRTVTCNECGLEFAFKAQLKRHYDFAHRTRFTCEFCGNISGSEIALFRHLQKHVLSEPFVCLMCCSEFDSTEAMKEHECYPDVEDPCKVVVRVALADIVDLDYEIDPLDQYDALKLQRKFDNRGRKPGSRPSYSNGSQSSYPKFHENTIENLDSLDKNDYMKNRSCKFCEKSFPTEADKLAHETIHLDGYTSATCSICHMKFSTNSKLARHLRIHTGENPFPCKFCTKAFPRQDYLQRHMFNVHVTDKETCPFCFKFCPTPKEFTEHVKLHQDGENPNTYFCDTCDMYFNQYCDYRSHMHDTHSSTSYKCRYCPKVFFNEKSKADHQHSCQLSSDASDDLDSFSVDETATFNNELELHECDMCNEKFNSFSEKLKHLKMIHKPEFYPCDLCPCKFVSSVGLRNHRSAVHFHTLRKKRHADIASFENLQTFSSDFFESEYNSQQNKNLYYCKDCNSSFQTLHEFLVHVREHSYDNLSVDELKCLLCNQLFISPEDLSSHLQSHDDNMIVEVGVQDGESEEKDALTINRDMFV